MKVKTKSNNINISEEKPNKKLIKALKEANKIQKNPEKYKGYHDIDELFNDILK